MTDLGRLYQTDYSEWARRNAELLRAGDFASLDIQHLLEELDDLGKSEQRELENRLTILLAHLLKWEYQLQHLVADSRRGLLSGAPRRGCLAANPGLGFRHPRPECANP